ncbi:hypothetical protein LIA77_09530 [Sarocladium implicatum]|nr:hypothetical protein LIA77_09530 [Sarocladium implicatum]
MAKSSRSSARKANAHRRATNINGPVEQARAERLSAKLLEIAQQPKPETSDVNMDGDAEEDKDKPDLWRSMALRQNRGQTGSESPSARSRSPALSSRRPGISQTRRRPRAKAPSRQEQEGGETHDFLLLQRRQRRSIGVHLSSHTYEHIDFSEEFKQNLSCCRICEPCWCLGRPRRQPKPTLATRVAQTTAPAPAQLQHSSPGATLSQDAPFLHTSAATPHFL